MSDVLGIEEIVGRARDEITDRMRAIGVAIREIRRVDYAGHVGLRFDVVGRDEACHSVTTNVKFGVNPSRAREDVVTKAIHQACKGHERIAARFGGLPPVEVGPGMSVDHLEVNAPLAARLRADHGDRARDVIRQVVVALDENRKAQGRSARDCGAVLPVPHDIRLNTNRLDHSEEIADGVLWRRHSIVMHRTVLPEILVAGYAGARASQVCDHPILADDRNVVASISNSDAATATSRRTAVITLTTPWIPVSQI